MTPKPMPAVGRRRVAASSLDWVRIEPPPAGRGLPALARPAVDGPSLVDWAAEHRAVIEEHLVAWGGLLFRGFDLDGASGLGRFVESAAGSLLEYRERSSPRHEVEARVYTSTDHPADQAILLHNENSYAASWPRKIFFFCLEPALRGGATPLADSRRVLGRIAPEVRRRFASAGVMYVRNFGDGLGLPWQQVFGTGDRREVEAYCRQAGLDCEWKGEDRLRTRGVRPAVATHPATGEAVWFNQVTLFHPAGLDGATREALRGEFAPDDLPTDVRYGDGSPIAAETVAEILDAYRRETVTFPWQRGDLLVLDNLLVAHGREPFEGPRRVVVGMAEGGTWNGR